MTKSVPPGTQIEIVCFGTTSDRTARWLRLAVARRRTVGENALSPDARSRKTLTGRAPGGAYPPSTGEAQPSPQCGAAEEQEVQLI